MRHDVLIVGAGPVGLTMALLLARQGIRVAILEKEQTLAALPSAVSLDDECLRIWQACGLEQALDEDWEGGKSNRVMCEYLNARGRPFLKLTQHESDLGYPHAVAVHLAGIVEKLRRFVERDPSIELLTDNQVVGIEQDDQSVSVKCLSHDGSSRIIHGFWAVGCDGGSSMTRTLLGIDMPGTTLPNPWLIAELEDGRVDECVRIRCEPQHPSVSVPMPHGVRRIERMLDLDDSGDWLDDESEVRRRLIPTWAGAATASIRSLAVMRFNARIAGRWRCGRVFLAGDAAHQTPPFAGQGLATGLRDAANLSFKLAGAQHGWLTDDVLDSYELERRPHQERMIQLALRLGRVMAPRSRMHAVILQSVIRASMAIGPVRKRVQLRGPGIRPVLREGFLTSGDLSGHYIPQPWITSGGSRRVRLDTLLGPRMTWIAIGDSDAPGRLPGSLLAPCDAALVENRDFRDPDRKLQKYFGVGSLVLVRPDRVVHTHCVPAMAQTLMSRNTPWISMPTRQPESVSLGALSA